MGTGTQIGGDAKTRVLRYVDGPNLRLKAEARLQMGLNPGVFATLLTVAIILLVVWLRARRR